ncbi:MAG: translation elongation factor Ts [bacterium]|nr:translation elongation factor Ts [bacterium]
MSNTKVENIKNLRDKTGAGMMDAKSALERAKGDERKAIEILRVKGQIRANKKSQRETKNGLIETYLHSGKIGVIVEVNCETDFVERTDEFKELAHDLAMHIAAASPEYITRAEVPKSEVDKEKKIIKKELALLGKPKEQLDKIIEGKMTKYYREVCLMDQPFVKDPGVTIEKLVNQKIAKLGENIVISRYARFELGETN